MSEMELNRKSPKKTGLGRGLGALFAENAPQVAAPPLPVATPAPIPAPVTTPAQPVNMEDGRVFQIDIEKLVANPKQPRREFVPEALQELAASIKEQGILLPIVAQKIAEDRYEIIAGERRWRAAQAAGLHQVPVLLRKTSEQKALELAIIENVQRENLNPIEEAEAYHRLVKDFGLTQQQVAEKVGKDRVTVANLLRLLQLSPEVRTLLAKGDISLGHAKVLLALVDPKQQRSLAEKVRQHKLSVREVEREVTKLLKPTVVAANHDPLAGDISVRFMETLSQELQKMVGTKVAIDYAHGKGKISVHFYSDEQLNSLVDRLKACWAKE